MAPSTVRRVGGSSIRVCGAPRAPDRCCDAVVVRSQNVDLLPGGRARLEQAWCLDELAAGYEGFLERFRGLADQVDDGKVDGAEALVQRTELVDDWRWLIRDDPDLPAELLPEGFPRKRARAIFLDVYGALADDARARFERLVGDPSSG